MPRGEPDRREEYSIRILVLHVWNSLERPTSLVKEIGKQIKVIFANREGHKNSSDGGVGPQDKKGVYSSINKMQRRRDKPKDKPAVDPERAYLDAKSSDEDEFGEGKIYDKNMKPCDPFCFSITSSRVSFRVST